MPYVPEQERRDVDGGKFPTTSGQLNYFLCQSILGKYFGALPNGAEGWEEFFRNVYQMYLDINGFRYQQCNDIGGAVMNVRREFEARGFADAYMFGLMRMKVAYRQFYKEVIRPYEAKKQAENGDIFHEDLLSRPDAGDTELQLPSV